MPLSRSLSAGTCAPSAERTSVRQEPVAFSLERVDGGYEWHTEGALVASATSENGLWQLHDARGAHVVTLVPLADSRAPPIGPRRPPGRPARVDPGRRRRPGADRRRLAGDPDGRPVLVLRTDGGQGAHLVDRRGDVVAVASWEEPDAVTDLLVTALGTRHSLAMVFGLLLSFELTRRADRPV